MTALSNGLMYFGTKERMRWVPAPAPGAGYTAEAYSNQMNYSNGGTSLRNSKGAHLEYDLTWGSLTRDQVGQIEDYAYGLYGDGLNYYVDPYAMDRNLFSAMWASPKLTAEDGIPLTGTTRPAKVLINDMSLDYPMYGAQYAVTAAQTARTFHLPIPVDYTAWVGVHGIASARGLKVQPTLSGIASGAATSLPTLAVTNATRFGGSFAGSVTGGIDISIDTTVTATITVAGLMLQLLPTGEVPSDGGFISGRGNSGAVFQGKPNRQVYSLPGESIAMTAKLVEVGDWL